PTANDNCSGATVTQNKGLPSGSAFPTGTTQIEYTATDACGNTSTCNFTVTVVDNTPPVMACPADVLKANDAGGCDAVVSYTVPTASDNCGPASVSCSPASGMSFAKGTTTVSCAATDGNGNISTCTFKVVVADTEAP